MTFRRFKTPEMAAWYAMYRLAPPKRAHNSAAHAYWNGFKNPTKPAPAVKGSLAYAAWAAGVDNRRCRHSA